MIYIMSNINAKNIVSENITVTNLNVTYINGAPYVPNPCNNPCKKGYYVPCPDCNYQGPDICDCGNNCDEVPYIPDECDCFVECNSGGGGGTGYTGPTGPPGGGTGLAGPAGVFKYYYDLESGAASVASGQGPGYIIDDISINGIPNNTVAYFYPHDVYFNPLAGGSAPWIYGSVPNGSYQSSVNTHIFYRMPYDGEITAVSVNSLDWFDPSNGKLEVIKATSTGTFFDAGVGLSGFFGSGLTFPIAGYTTTINSPNFSAGDGIAVVVKEETVGPPPWNLPFGPTGGVVSITVFTKFNN